MVYSLLNLLLVASLKNNVSLIFIELFLTYNIEQYFLDKDCYINWTLVGQILKGEKHVFKLAQIQEIQVPNYPELKVVNLLAMVQNDANVRRYLRDDVDERKISRHFLCTIINTVYPNYLSVVIDQ